MRNNVEHYNYEILNDAHSILHEIGMPKQLCNPRCVMTLVAYAEMTDGERWRNASEGYHSTHDIIRYINTNFPNKAGLDTSGYSENSRETFRKYTIKPWITAGIMEQKPGLATNDKYNSYRLTAVFTALIRNYGSSRWEEELQHFKETHESYQDLLRQTRNIEQGYPVDYNGLVFRLGRSKHNQLQISVLNEFVTRFAPGASLLYIGDTSDRSVVRKDDDLAKLGIDVLTTSMRLPDIILYDEKKDRVIFIEAYSSTGEFTMDRVLEMRSYCHCPKGRELAFITAFEATKTMLSVFSRISWDTDIWVAEDPTHITHKNGDRFMGRKDGDWWDQS